MFKVVLVIIMEPSDPLLFNEAQSLSRFVSGLPNFDSVYLSWLKSIEHKTPFIPVPLNEEQAANILYDTRELDDEGQIWSLGGSRAKCYNVGPKPYNCANNYQASTEFTLAKPVRLKPKGFTNSIYMNLAQTRASTGRSWRASELRPLMKFAHDIWRPTEMYVYFDYYVTRFPSYNPPSIVGPFGKVCQALPRALNPIIGWITYLPPHLAARANIPAGFAVEGLSDGGVLVTVSEDPFPETDAVNIARLQTLETALRPIQSRD